MCGRQLAPILAFWELRWTQTKTKYREAMSFSTMGVGVEFNEKLLQKIAQDSNGKYHYIGDPAEIPTIFEDELQGLRAVTVRNGRVRFPISSRVRSR